MKLKTADQGDRELTHTAVLALGGHPKAGSFRRILSPPPTLPGLDPSSSDRASIPMKEDGEPCSCKTPWDYCCETDKLPGAMALVQFVESDGTPVKQDARKIFELEELQTVIVKGKAQRDDAGNLTVMASAMFVRK